MGKDSIHLKNLTPNRRLPVVVPTLVLFAIWAAVVGVGWLFTRTYFYVSLLWTIPLLAIGWIALFQTLQFWRNTLMRRAKKLVQQSIRGEREQFSAMLGSVPDQLCVLDRELNIVWANDIAKQNFGDDVVGRKCYAMYHGRKKPCEPYPCFLLQTFEDGKTRTEEKIITDKRGNSAYYRCKVNVITRDKKGKPLLVLEAVQNLTKQRKAEAAFDAMNRHLQGVLSASIQVGIIATDPEGIITLFNTGAERILGYTSDEIVGKHTPGVFHLASEMEKRAAELTEELGEPISGFDVFVVKPRRGEYELREWTYVRKDGSHVPVNLVATVMRDEKNEISGYLGIAYDITKQKQAEKSLAVTNRKLQGLLDASSKVSITATDQNGVMTIFNTGAERLLGYTAEEMIGKQTPEIYHLQSEMDARAKELTEELGEPISGFEVFIAKQRRGGYGEYEEREWTYVRKDGSHVPVNLVVTVMKDEKGEVTGVVGIASDITKQKQTEEELRRSEERFRGIAMSMYDWIWECDAEGHYTYCSEHVLDVLGYTVEEFMTKTPFDIMTEEQAQKVREIFREAKTNPTPVREYENINIAKDGRKVLLLTNAMPIIDKEGNFRGFRGVDKDITEQRKAERELRQSEERFRDIVMSISDWIWECDAQGRFTFSSDQSLELLGYSCDEVIGKSIFEFMPKAEEERVKKVFYECKKNRRGVRDFENRNIAKDGHEVILMTNAIPMLDATGIPVGFRGINKDVTEQKRAEEERRVLLQSMQERVKELTCLYNVAKSIRQCKTLDDLFQDVVETIPASWHHPGNTRARIIFEDKEYVSTPFEKTDWKISSDITANGKRCGTIEVYYLKECPELDEGPFMDEECRLVNGIGQSLSDAIQWKQAEQEIQDYAAALERNNEELAELNEAVEAANEAKSEFLANMSHEIRTPMTAILGFSEILTDNLTDKEQLDAAKTIRKNGEYLIRIINDILDLSKIEAGKMVIEHLPCSPFQILSEVASLMRVRADAKNLALEIEYDGPIPERIQSDPTRLRQILINLVGNAIKFTEIGSVRLVTRLLDFEKSRPKIQFEVSDTGIGMARSQIDRLFKPFTQVDASTTRKRGGTGLGLAISKRLAEKLGGDITVESVLRKGSTFIVTVQTGSLEGVKMVEGEVETTAASEKKSPATAFEKGCRVLLAEDGHDNQRLISFLLSKAGAKIEIAENGQIAYNLAMAAKKKEEPFDVVLMDMQMPIMDGYTATTKLRQAGYAGPIIALTAHAMSTDRKKCLDAGCDDYVVKPIDKDQLIAAVSQHAVRQTTTTGGNK